MTSGVAGESGCRGTVMAQCCQALLTPGYSRPHGCAIDHRDNVVRPDGNRGCPSHIKRGRSVPHQVELCTRAHRPAGANPVSSTALAVPGAGETWGGAGKARPLQPRPCTASRYARWCGAALRSWTACSARSAPQMLTAVERPGFAYPAWDIQSDCGHDWVYFLAPFAAKYTQSWTRSRGGGQFRDHEGLSTL